MIPTVEEILQMLFAKQCTHEQAMGWIEQHLISAAVEALSIPQPEDSSAQYIPTVAEIAEKAAAASERDK